MPHLTLVPAYGRDYKSKKEVLEGRDAGKDFEAVGIDAGGYINKPQAVQAGVGEVNIRYKKLTQVAVVRVGK